MKRKYRGWKIKSKQSNKYNKFDYINEWLAKPWNICLQELQKLIATENLKV